MPRKTENAKPKSMSGKQSVQPETPAQGAPIERYRGEVTRGERNGDLGDLEEETLDRDAPFNKSYGVRDEDGSAPLP